MRTFDYRRDYNLISLTIKEYIQSFLHDVEWLAKNDSREVYLDALIKIKEFIKKYPILYDVCNSIIDDLLKPENVEYCYANKEYRSDASKIGMEFQDDLTKIIELEEQLKKISIQAWERDLTPDDEIRKGEKFMIVGHAAHNYPGVVGDPNYHSGMYSHQYISCSLLSNNELNTFQDIRIVFVTDVNEENYLCSSSFDSVTAVSFSKNFLTIGEIDDGDQKHYIKAGYTNGGKVNTTISTPKKIEEESVKREVEQTGEKYNYKTLTNEIVLDRTKTRITGALLISNGCDLLFDEFLFLKMNNISFKCINRGLYREQNGMDIYTEEEYNAFIQKLRSLINNIGRINVGLLKDYYYEVVLNMNYSEEVIKIIKDEFSHFVDLNKRDL